MLAGCQLPPELGGLKSETSRDILLKVAARAQESHDYGSAAVSYRTLYERNPEDREAILGLARNLRYVGSLRDAELVLDKELTRSPNDARLLAERGKMEMARGQPLNSIGYFGRSLDRDAKDWQTHSALGIARDLLGRHDEARNAYRAALDLAPDRPEVLNNLALSLAMSGSIDEAIAILAKLQSRPSAPAHARQNLALLYAFKGDYARSESLARQDLTPALLDNNLIYFRSLRPRPVKESAVLPDPRPVGGDAR